MLIWRGDGALIRPWRYCEEGWWKERGDFEGSEELLNEDDLTNFGECSFGDGWDSPEGDGVEGDLPYSR